MDHRVTRKPRMFGRRRAACIAAWLLLAAGAAGVKAQDGDGLMLRADEGAWMPAVLLDTDVRMRVRGLVAEVEVHQVYRNDSDRWLEGRYLLPLPETSAVHLLRVEADGRLIEGEVREKEQARRIHGEAAAAGQRSALVEQNRPNLFQTRIANIAPGEELTVTVGYWQQVDWRDGHFELSLPLTLVPRYTPPSGPGAGEVPAEALPADPATRDRFAGLEPTVSISVDLAAGVPIERVESPTHKLDVAKSGEGHRVSLADTVVPSDRDFVLRWTPPSSKEVASALFVEEHEGERYALVMLVPPTAPVQALPRELVLVVDTSGSMHGTSMEQARAALHRALDRLGPNDRFNLMSFASTTNALWSEARPVQAGHVAEARRWVDGLAADGGTHLAPALELALAGAPPPGLLRQVVLLTDAGIGNERELFDIIEARLGEARLFPVGIGSAPNGHFLRQAALLGRGSELVVRSIDEVEAQVGALFARLDRPALRDLDLAWPPGSEAFPERVPDLYAGEPLLAVARLAGDGSVEARGWHPGGEWRKAMPLAGPATDEGVARLWARAKLGALDEQLRQGAPEDAIRPLMLDVALAHRLVSRFTSLVAVEKQAVRPPDAALDAVRFANATPAGSLAMASGGTGSRSRLAIAAALALLALAVFGGGRRRDAGLPLA